MEKLISGVITKKAAKIASSTIALTSLFLGTIQSATLDL